MRHLHCNGEINCFNHSQMHDYGDQVTLYNMRHNASFVLYQDNDTAYTALTMYKAKRNESSRQSVVEFDRDSRNDTFTHVVFQIQGASNQHGRINDNDTIQFQSMDTSKPMKLNAMGLRNRDAEFPGGAPLRIMGYSPNNTTVLQLRDGSEFEFPGLTDSMEHWKVFIASRTLINKTLSIQKQQYEQNTTQLKSQMHQTSK